METCSNCGATNRPGAKFCTSCGVRLPALSPQTTADWDRPTSGSTSAAAATTTPEPDTVDDTTASTSPVADDEAATDDAPAAEPAAATTSWSEPATTENATPDGDAHLAATPGETDTAPATEERSTWSWGQTETPPHDDTGESIDADEPRPDATAADTEPTAAAEPLPEPPEAESDDTGASTGGPEGDSSSTLSNWASQWTGEYAAAPETGDEQPASAEAEPVTDRSDVDAGSPSGNELDSALGAATTGSATAQSGLASASGTGVEPPAIENDDALTSASVSPATDDQSGAMQRAGDLLDELRGLLPILAAPPAAAAMETPAPEMADETTPAADTSGIAADLAAARADAADTTDLRRTLESARNRQRDVDTMIDIVGRIDPMLAALDVHDRYAAAIDRAITRLRGDTASADDEPGSDWQAQ